MTGVRRKLLVVDDEPFNLEIIAEHLGGEGYDLVNAADGEEAWAILTEASSDEFEALVLDRMMPRMDGMELLKRIKQETRFRQIPVIMQTAAASKEQVVEGIRNGAYYYLTKPFDGEILAAVVRAAVADRAARREMSNAANLEASTFRLLTEARFRFQSVTDARRLALSLSGCFPDSPNAGLGFLELLINAVEHGNLGITLAGKTHLLKADRWEEEIAERLAAPENKDKWVRVHYVLHGNTATVHIADDGEGFDWRTFAQFDPARAFDPNGRGIALARQLCFPELEYLGSGNEVRVTLPIRG
ncbi:MAG: response regulator [Betaproteobacteria bacterium]